MKWKTIGVAAVIALLVGVAGNNAVAEDNTKDNDEISDTQPMTGGVLLAQVSTPKTAAGNPPATATKKAEPKSSKLDALRAEYDALKKAWVAYKDKNDGQSTGRDLLTLIIALIAATATLGKTGLRYWKRRRTDERTPTAPRTRVI